MPLATVGLVAAGLAVTQTGAQAATWPTPNSSKAVTTTKSVSGTKDYGMQRLYGSGDLGAGGQNEGQDPILELAARRRPEERDHRLAGRRRHPLQGQLHAEERLVGGRRRGRGDVHGLARRRTCTPLDGGGAKEASDKVFQHNGAGTLNVSNFAVQNFGKLVPVVRQLQDASTSARRQPTTPSGDLQGQPLAGINTNYGDTATF